MLSSLSLSRDNYSDENHKIENKELRTKKKKFPRNFSPSRLMASTNACFLVMNKTIKNFHEQLFKDIMTWTIVGW